MDDALKRKRVAVAAAHPGVAPNKTDRSLVALVPPEPLWPTIEAIRRVHDHNQPWLAPHVTLLCPFLEQATFERSLPALREACAGIAPFTLKLEGFSTFSHRGSRHVIWLVPEPREPLATLHDTLFAAFPMCHEQASVPQGFTPHLTVGRAVGDDACQRLLDELRRSWVPLDWHVDRVALLYKPRRRPYGVVGELPLMEARL